MRCIASHPELPAASSGWGTRSCGGFQGTSEGEVGHPSSLVKECHPADPRIVSRQAGAVVFVAISALMKLIPSTKEGNACSMIAL